MRKGFVFPLAIIVSLIVITIFGLSSIKQNFSQKEKNLNNASRSDFDPLPSWKRYINETYGFSIRYPKDWFVLKYEDYAANFVSSDPQIKEASPAAVKVYFVRSQEKADVKEFEKIHKLASKERTYEPLDIKSIITKEKNFNVGDFQAIEYQIERNFSAPEGPRKLYSRAFQINRGGIILKFSTNSSNYQEFQKINEPILNFMISSLQFN